jgi:DNA processing protein
MRESLFIKGNFNLKDLKTAVAIVGTRDMSSRGEKLAYEFAFNLAKEGIVIISGLARGIDTIAHRAALDAGGTTIAVLGCGIDLIYPPENKDLASEIMENGCLVSQFPGKTSPLGKNFLERNKIIAFLSQAILIVEGKRRSGTLSTATHAANLGREVFAIPGSEVTDYLIDEGATIAIRPESILEYLNGTNNC